MTTSIPDMSEKIWKTLLDCTNGDVKEATASLRTFMKTLRPKNKHVIWDSMGVKDMCDTLASLIITNSEYARRFSKHIVAETFTTGFIDKFWKQFLIREQTKKQ